jgi:hypothetical protein
MLTPAPSRTPEETKMFNKALVGVDPSPAEESLLACLPDLSRWGICSIRMCASSALFNTVAEATKLEGSIRRRTEPS